MLIVFDVDDFKHVNDVYGHVKGALCLSIIANCIKKAYAKYGYCYRIGGDEFCVLLKNCRNEESCSIQFDHLMKSKQRKYKYLPSVSYGSALLLTGDIVSVKDELLNQGLTQKEIEDLTQKGFSKEEIIQSHQYDNEIKKGSNFISWLVDWITWLIS